MLTKKYFVLLMSLAGGLLLSLSWPENGIASVLFFAIIPFLIVEDTIYKNPEKFSGFAVLFYTYPGFFLWNLLTTWWIYEASMFGAVMAVLFNSLFMAIVFQLAHYCKKVLNKSSAASSDSGYFVLIVFWLSFEYFHLNWELSWPWLQLGNGFASALKSVQWYEYTGVLGGSLWVLVMNVLFFRMLKLKFEKKPIALLKRMSIAPFIVLLLPLVASWTLYYTYKEDIHPVDIVVIQPNVDPYGEKFVPEFRDEIWRKLLGQSVIAADENTDFILWPETSVPGSIPMNQPDEPYAITKMKDSTRVYFPNAVLVTGADGYEIYETKKTATARYFKDGACCWDSYNTALEIDSSGLLNYYHKSKLVPGVERMPYPQVFGFLEKFAIDLGGSSGSLGTSDDPIVFTNGKVPVAPVICYESVYGDFVAKYIRKGAELIFILTNDGWWDDTPGYRQHFMYASLRAIETRRSIARSANTGISGFINQRGDVLQSLGWWKEGTLRQTINANSKLTVYVRYGDYLGRVAAFAALAIVIIVTVRRLTRKRLSQK
jgi:apolipoprotein N-acyltransferase